MTTISKQILSLCSKTPASASSCLELAANLAPALLASCLVVTLEDTEAALELVSDLINDAATQWQEDTK